MKYSRIGIRFLILSIFLVIISSDIFAQEGTARESELKKLVESKNFVFQAESVLPVGGSFKTLTSEYNLKVFGDTLISYLPYYGKAYATIDPGEGPIQFTSTKFDYFSKTAKKGGWDIQMYPKDTKDVRQIFLHISTGGYATLQVTSLNRQPISFNGEITSGKMR